MPSGVRMNRSSWSAWRSRVSAWLSAGWAMFRRAAALVTLRSCITASNTTSRLRSSERRFTRHPSWKEASGSGQQVHQPLCSTGILQCRAYIGKPADTVPSFGHGSWGHGMHWRKTNVGWMSERAAETPAELLVAILPDQDSPPAALIDVATAWAQAFPLSVLVILEEL